MTCLILPKHYFLVKRNVILHSLKFTQWHLCVTGHPNQPTLPLLRLRIEHESDQQFLNTRDLHVELSLEKLVANPEDVVKLVRKRSAQEKIEATVDEEAWDAVFNMEVFWFL